MQHLGQPVERSIRIRAANGFNKRGYRVIMGISIAIIEHCPFLNGFLRDIEIDADNAFSIWFGALDSQFKCI